MKIASVQAAVSSDLKSTMADYEKQLREAARQGAELVVLPELFHRPYFAQTQNPGYFDWAEPLTGENATTMQWGKEQSQTHAFVLVLPFFERRQAGIYHNTVAVWDKGRLAGIYRKMHIPQDPGYEEKFYFTPGDLGLYPIETSVGRLGVLICWDQWYPEAARLMALRGADCLIYPTAIGWDPTDSQEEQQRQLEAWKTIQRGHAIANGLPVISCNRVGLEPHPEKLSPGALFWGNSFIAGPQGEVLSELSQQEPALMVQGVDFSRSETVRRIWPFFRDRRIDAYEGLLKRSD